MIKEFKRARKSEKAIMKRFQKEKWYLGAAVRYDGIRHGYHVIMFVRNECTLERSFYQDGVFVKLEYELL